MRIFYNNFNSTDIVSTENNQRELLGRMRKGSMFEKSYRPLAFNVAET